MKLIVSILIFTVFISCKNESKKQSFEAIEGKFLHIKYAKGFSSKDYGNYKILEINTPWPNSNKSYRYLLAYDSIIRNLPLDKSKFDGIITPYIKKIVVTSTTHIPALELLRVQDALIGFPGTDYISSQKTRQRIAEQKVRELGRNEGINTEVLLELNPDVVIGFGIDGVNKTYETLKKANIPVIYNGDWVESSALAKAEWIKFFGVLFNKERASDSIFNAIEIDYLKAKAIAKNAKTKPTVLSGAMHKEVWYLPNGNSTEAQLLKDANVNYLWSDTKGNGSLALSFEVVLEKAKTAHLWLNPSYYSSFNQLETANGLYTNFEAFKTKNIYSFVNKTGATGGVLYYELGIARPDLILKDIIKICHPELLKDYKPYFYSKLN